MYLCNLFQIFLLAKVKKSVYFLLLGKLVVIYLSQKWSNSVEKKCIYGKLLQSKSSLEITDLICNIYSNYNEHNFVHLLCRGILKAIKSQFSFSFTFTLPLATVFGNGSKNQ